MNSDLVAQLAQVAKTSIPPGTLGPTDWIVAYNEKLAELIASECADIAVHNQTGWEAGMRIKEHFGVEE